MSARVTCSCGWTRTYPTAAAAETYAARHVCKKAVRRATRHYRCARCGFEATYTNAGAVEARAFFNRHSCQKQEQLALRAALAQQKRDLVDRTPKPCHHKIANHQHGQRATYVLDRCRCEPCSKANAEAETWRERQKAYGRYHKYLPASPVREHVRALMDAGVGLKRISKVSGVAHGSLWKLVYGKRQADGTQVPSIRVLRSTAEKLYAIDPTWTDQPLPIAPGARDVARTPTARLHVRALVALGWSMSRLGTELGFNTPRNFIRIVTSDDVMTRTTVDKIEALYERLSMTLPPETNRQEKTAAARSRNYAKAKGWLPPLALDDEPDVEILDEVAIRRRMDGDKTVQLTRSERLELIRQMHEQGLQDPEIARRTGYYSRQVFRDRQDLGLPANQGYKGLVASDQFGARGDLRRRQEEAS